MQLLQAKFPFNFEHKLVEDAVLFFSFLCSSFIVIVVVTMFLIFGHFLIKSFNSDYINPGLILESIFLSFLLIHSKAVLGKLLVKYSGIKNCTSL